MHGRGTCSPGAIAAVGVGGLTDRAQSAGYADDHRRRRSLEQWQECVQHAHVSEDVGLVHVAYAIGSRLAGRGPVPGIPALLTSTSSEPTVSAAAPTDAASVTSSCTDRAP